MFGELDQHMYIVPQQVGQVLVRGLIDLLDVVIEGLHEHGNVLLTITFNVRRLIYFIDGYYIRDYWCLYILLVVICCYSISGYYIDGY